MQREKKMVAGVLVCALVCSSLSVTQADAKAAKGYTISKKAGTYKGSVKVKVKAKKGFTVYYTTGKKLSKSKKIKAKKSKSFTFKKTTTLRIYAVKASKKMTAKKLKAVKTKKMAKYRYKITANSINNSPTADTTNGSTATNTPDTPGTTAQVTQTPGTSTPGTPTPDAGDQPLVTPGNSQYEGDDALADYVEPARFTFEDEDKDTSAEGAIEITMPAEAPGETISDDGKNYTISTKNKLTIKKAGTYRISSEGEEVVKGSIEVDKEVGTIHLILDDLHLKATKDGDDATLSIKKDNTRAIITLQEGTVNSLTNNGVEEQDETPAGILCKKTPLTINGKGTLNVISPNANGIKCTDELKILDATISVNGGDNESTGNNGITGKKGLAVKDADLMIYSDGDGLKTTLDESDVKDDPTLAESGNMEIDGGAYNIISENGDGISVYRTLYLNPTELDVTTKNAAGSTEDSSYKGVKAGTTIFFPETAGTLKVDTTATYSAQRAGRDSNDPVADDTIHCDGYIKIDGGTCLLASGDDGIHSDKGLVINDGNIQITDSYEGLESGDISINGGDINIKSRDDGINAGGGNNTPEGGAPGMGDDSFHKGDSAKVTNYQIIITGGVVTVDAEGDGIDSNGNIFFKGGMVKVNGPTRGGNGALDYGDNNCVCEISGGTLIAAGSVGMDAAPTSGSTQPAVNVRFSSVQEADTYVVLKDSDGNTVLQAQPTKTFQSIILSFEALKLGSTYTVYYGKDLNSLTQGDSVTFTSTSVATGSSTGGGWRPGGWGPGGGNRPGF